MQPPRDLTTIAGIADCEQVIKRSRFLGAVGRCADEAQALAFIARLRSGHPGAHHVCFAFRVAPIVRFSDDGEPGGTAGRPMAELLARRGLDRVVAVVVRYFGGVKLGAGGLVRAYAGTLARTLDAAGVAVLPALIEVRVSAPYASSDALFRLLDERPELERGDVAYRAEGVSVDLRFPGRDFAAFDRALRDATRGAASLSPPRELPHLNGL